MHCIHTRCVCYSLNTIYKMWRFIFYLSLSLFPLTSVLASTPTVEEIAEKITVRIEGRVSLGSGVLIEHQGNTYYILTNAHVVKQPETYIIFVPGDKCYQVEYTDIKALPGLDLAVLPINTNLSYQVAKLGNSDQVIPGNKVYVSGWTYIGDVLRSLIFFGSMGEITEINSQLPQGYSLTYTNLVRVGMSGGPMLNDQGKLIGINGIVRFATYSDDIVGSGIPINQFLRWRSTLKKTIPVKPQQPIKCPSQSSDRLPLL